MTSSEYLTEDANDITAQPIREADVGNGPVTVMSSNFGAADLLMEPNPPVMRPIGSQTSPLDGFMQPKHDLDQPVVNPESAEGVELRRAALREAFMALTDEERTSILVAMPITASGSSPQKNVNANPSVPPIKVSLPARQYLLSEEDDEPVNESSGERIFAFQHHEALRDLVRLKKHLPLMLFLAKSIETLFLDFGSIPTITNKGVGGTAKHTVIDTSFFPDKAKMDIADWSEAWGNILVFYKENSSPGYFQRQLDHHNWMIGCQFLKENFATILRFDILIRKEHAASPVEFVLLIYKEKYLRVEHEVMAEELMALHAETAAFKTSQHYSSSLSTPPRSSQRSEHAASSARPSPQGSPFQKGSGGVAGSPICLICARLGHRFSKCSQTSFESGKPLWSTYSNSKLTSSSTQKPICIVWNLSGSARCSSHSVVHPLHACSFCGNTSHHATLCACL